MAESEFSKLERKLAKKKGMRNARALTAYIGDEELGKHEMAERSAESREKHKRERKRH